MRFTHHSLKVIPVFRAPLPWFRPEGNFNAHHKRKNPPAREYRKLPHGRVSINTESLRLTLNVGLDEHGIIPAQVLLSESQMASHFVQGMAMDEIPNH